MKKNPTEAGQDAKAAFHAEGLRLLEVVGADAHAAILEELGRLEDPPELSAEPDESLLLARGPLGHDADPADRLLPPDAHSAAFWETRLAGAAS